MKKLICREIGMDCDIEFTGETDEEIMQKAADHTLNTHNLPSIPPHSEEKCRKAIRVV